MNYARIRTIALVSLLCMGVASLGCASAGKRYEQGLQMESRGQYEAAASRYVQALEKESDHGEARQRLSNVGQMAIAERLSSADAWNARSAPVEAALEYQRADAVIQRARTVGVRLTAPSNYAPARRTAFDDAIESLVNSGESARSLGKWQAGLASCRQARTSFEASAAQEQRALTVESKLLVDWSQAEYDAGHLRASYGVASKVAALPWTPLDENAMALNLMDQALVEGEVEILVLPMREKTEGRRRARRLAGAVEAELQQDAWRNSPAFVRVHDPLLLRDLLNHTGLFDGGYESVAMAALLRLTEADYGARLQLQRTEVAEFDVRGTKHVIRKKDGQSTTFTREEGQRRIHAEARVLIVDSFGNSIADVVVSAVGAAPFSRGVYDGDPSELSPSRRQFELFDARAQEQQMRAAEAAVVANLAEHVSSAVYEPVLALIP